MSLMNDVKSQMQRGTAPPSVGKLAIEKQSEFGLNDLETAYALSSPWMAGVGTVSVNYMLQETALIRTRRRQLPSMYSFVSLRSVSWQTFLTNLSSGNVALPIRDAESTGRTGLCRCNGSLTHFQRCSIVAIRPSPYQRNPEVM
jgi:hypothetical protein